MKDNEFEVDVPVALPPAPTIKLNQWLNKQWTGKKDIPLTEMIKAAHKEAAYRLHRGRLVRLKFQITKTGQWELVEAKLR